MRHVHSSDFRRAGWLVGAVLLCGSGCGGSDAAPDVVDSGEGVAPTKVAAEKVPAPVPAALPVDSEFVPSGAGIVDRTPTSRPRIVLRTSRGDVTLELFRDAAPKTVENFLQTYVENGLYAHSIFHHVDAGFIAIAGGYDEELRPVYAGDPIPNESSPDRKNVRGTIAMIRQPDDADSATSQFFFNLGDNADFDASQAGEGYCVFGRVVEGLEILDAIASSPTMSTGEFEKIPSDLAQIASVEVVRY